MTGPGVILFRGSFYFVTPASDTIRYGSLEPRRGGSAGPCCAPIAGQVPCSLFRLFIPKTEALVHVEYFVMFVA